MSKSYVHISPETLLAVCDKCIEQRANYDREDAKGTHKVFSWKKLKYVDEVIYSYPMWACDYAGVAPRLRDLRSVALNVIADGKVQDRDIKLSETSHVQLYKLLNMSSGFQAYVFGLGY